MKNRIFFITDFLFIIIILAATANSIISTIIKKSIIQAIEKTDDFKLQLNSFKSNIFTGSIESKVEFSSISQKIEVQTLNISHFNIYKWFKENRIEINEIKINELAISSTKTGKDSSGKSLNENLKSIFNTGKIKSIQIGLVNIQNAGYNLSDADKSRSYLTINGATIKLFNLHGDEQKKELKPDSMSGFIRSSVIIPQDSLYTITIGNTTVSSGSGIASVDNISVSPNYGLKEYSIKVGSQTDRFEVQMSNLTATGFDIRRLLLNNELIASAIIIDTTLLKVYRDKYFEAKLIRKKQIRELINDMGMKIRVDECTINSTSLSYKELIPPSKSPGVISLSNIMSNISNITNIDTATMIMVSNCKVAGTAQLNLKIKFPADENAFSGNGKLTNLKMDKLNSLFIPMSAIKVTTGNIDAMQFSFSSDENNIDGIISMVYHDLKVSAIDRATKDTTGILRDLKTILFNTAIDNSSDADLNKVPKALVKRKYVKEKFIIYNILHTILEGIKKSIITKL